MFCGFCAADWTKHGCFPLSARRIWQNTDVSRFPRGGLDETRMFWAFRAADWTKHECFMLSARQIGRNTDVLRFLRGGFGKTRMFHAFRMADLMKSPCSAAQKKMPRAADNPPAARGFLCAAVPDYFDDFFRAWAAALAREISFSISCANVPSAAALTCCMMFR